MLNRLNQINCRIEELKQLPITSDRIWERSDLEDEKSDIINDINEELEQYNKLKED